MKQVFFFMLLVLLPVLVIGGGILYLFWHTCYALYDNWKLSKELQEIRAACQAKRKRPEDGSGKEPVDETSSD